MPVFAVPSTLLGSLSAPRRIIRAPSVPVSMPQCRTAATTAVFPKIPHSNSCKRGSNRPLRPRRGRFGTLLQQLVCGIFGRTAVVARSLVDSSAHTSSPLAAWTHASSESCASGYWASCYASRCVVGWARTRRTRQIPLPLSLIAIAWSP